MIIQKLHLSHKYVLAVESGKFAKLLLYVILIKLHTFEHTHNKNTKL